MPRKGYPPETVSAIRELIAAGVPGVEIAKRLRLNIGCLRSWLSRRGLKVRKPGPDVRRRRNRLAQLAQRRGLKLEKQHRFRGKWLLWKPVTEPTTLDEIEALLTDGAHRLASRPRRPATPAPAPEANHHAG